MTSMRLSYGFRTDRGKERVKNEDSIVVRPDLGLVVVADGMGGHEAGEIASRVAVQAVLVHACERDTWDVQNAAKAAASAVDTTAARLSVEKMGTTLDVVSFVEGFVRIAHVGDGRVYRYRRGAFDRLTKDHTAAEALRARGAKDISPRAENALTRCLGGPRSAPDLLEVAFETRDRFLVCTDGLYREVPQVLLGRVIAEHSPDDAAGRLLGLALQNGGRDNITCAVVAVD